MLRSRLLRSVQSIELYSKPKRGLILYDMKNPTLKESIRQMEERIAKIPKDGYVVIKCDLEAAVKASQSGSLPGEFGQN